MILLDTTRQALDLFSAPALARTTDPTTSSAAAASVDVSKLEQAVLRALRAFGPTTMHQVAEVLGIGLVSISPRFAPLRRAGRIVAVGREGKRTLWQVA